MKIGVFDSGVGGLTVLREIEKAFPDDSFIYFGDTARCPYGPKGEQTIIRYSIENTIFLLEQNVDCVIVACNTATSLAITRLQNTFHVPIIGVIEPAAKRAAEMSSSGRIGVIGTKATIHSGVYQRMIKEERSSAHVIGHACPLFVPLVEDGFLNEEVIRLIVKEYMAPFKREGIDTLVLGCTHYPLLTSYIREELGEKVHFVDPAVCSLDALKAVKMALPPKKLQKPDHRFFVSDDPEKFSLLAHRFFGRALPHIEKVSSSF